MRPYWWETLLLLAAAYRLWRLLAFDTILDRPRTWVLGGIENWGCFGKTKAGKARADYWTLFITCPWCAGFWLTGAVLAGYCGVYGWIGTASFLTHWFAMSLAVGLLGSKVDT